MYRRTENSRQLSLQTGVYQHLNSTAAEQFIDKDSWHNIFFKQVVSNIDENLFKELFSKSKGSPNASISTLIGMMILKEGQGCSDKKLFESCRFNLLIRKSLGFVNIDDKLPAESTYYLLRKRINEYFDKTGIDLFEECFKNITKKQVLEFEVSGKSVRMDSKLIGSNIAFYSRYELIHKTLLLFYKKTFKKHFKILPEEDLELLNEFVKEKSASTVYNSSKEDINKRLLSIGKLIYTITNTLACTDNIYFQTLNRVFKEQYNILENSEIDIKIAKQISAKSVQSPHDTDCDFRSKDTKKTKGYNQNITETCDDDNKVNLITNVETQPATHPDNEFVQTCITASAEVLEDEIKNLHSDGAYNSEDNQAFTSQEDINFYLTGFQGKKGRYKLELLNDEFKVFDNQLDKYIEFSITKNNKYRITTEKGYRYFTDKEIESSRLREQVEALPKEIKNKRNNVEASVFQIAYPLRKDKTKYRGLFKNKIWIILRALWVNSVRIAKYLGFPREKSIQKVTSTLHLFVHINSLLSTLFLTPLELSEN